MPITTVYRKYFQKSKVFLYPLLDIKRGTSVIPSETYLAWNDTIVPEDAKLVCIYPLRQDVEYKQFEKNVLLKHSRLHDLVKVNSETVVIVFDFSDMIVDWTHFINGRYSQISDPIKKKILNFFDRTSGNYMYVEGYLYPKLHFDDYAKILGVDKEMLISVGELCDKPNIDKETLILEVANLESLKV
jgi:hypothetical protein